MNFKFTIKSLLFLLMLSSCLSSSNETKTYNSIEDIRKSRIGVILGSNHDILFSKEMPEADIIRVESETDLYMNLQQGRCDAIVNDHVSFNYTKSQFPDMAEIPSNFSSDYYGIAFRKEDSTLCSQFNDFLKEIKDNGLYQEIYDRWIIHNTKSKMPTINIPTEGKPLRVAYSGIQYPFAFLSDQKLAGFDIEISMQFAQKLKRPIEFQNISFASLIVSLQSSKSDMIASTMSITEERKKMVLFSDPYFETKTVVMTIPNKATEASSENFWQATKESFYNNLLKENRYLLIIKGLKTTLIISIFSLILGTILGGLICFMRMSKKRWLRNVASSYISLIQGIPVLVLLMMMFYVIFADLHIEGIYVAIITFAINFSAYVSEMFRTSIQSVDNGQTEAGFALGFKPAQTFYYIVMPQAIKYVIPIYKGEMISLIKTTSIVGYIAVEDVTKMSDIIRSLTFDAFFPLVIVSILYFIIAWIFVKAIDLLSFKMHSKQ